MNKRWIGWLFLTICMLTLFLFSQVLATDYEQKLSSREIAEQQREIAEQQETIRELVRELRVSREPNIWQRATFLAALAAFITALLSIFSYRRTNKSLLVDNYFRVVDVMNKLRDLRIQYPELERALFETRQFWPDWRVRTHVYGVQLASIFEFVYLAHSHCFIDEQMWNDWENMWAGVILRDEAMQHLLNDETLYSISGDAFREMQRLIERAKHIKPTAPNKN